jgi:hypothetical protein
VTRYKFKTNKLGKVLVDIDGDWYPILDEHGFTLRTGWNWETMLAAIRYYRKCRRA